MILNRNRQNEKHRFHEWNNHSPYFSYTPGDSIECTAILCNSFISAQSLYNVVATNVPTGSKTPDAQKREAITRRSRVLELVRLSSIPQPIPIYSSFSFFVCVKFMLFYVWKVNRSISVCRVWIYFNCSENVCWFVSVCGWSVFWPVRIVCTYFWHAETINWRCECNAHALASQTFQLCRTDDQQTSESGQRSRRNVGSMTCNLCMSKLSLCRRPVCWPELLSNGRWRWFWRWCISVMSPTRPIKRDARPHMRTHRRIHKFKMVWERGCTRNACSTNIPNFSR